jgi:DNA modification methylase
MILQGDAIKRLKDLPDELVNCCVTSPPYFGLRDYGVDGQIGLEETPEAYINRLVEVFREAKRVLRNDGTLWLNIGDSYSGSGKGGQSEEKRSENWKPEYSNKGKCYGLKPKDLIGIPWMLAFALRADGWYLRQDIIWHKPNPMPESVTDRCTKSHEYIFLLSKSKNYYYDAETIAEPVTQSTIDRLSQDIENQQGSERVPGKTNGAMKASAPRYGGKKYTENPDVFNRTKSGNVYEFRENRNKRDVWSVATQPFKEAHFATFPKELIRPCILAGCPVGGVALDPFFGSGTVGEVALEENRDFIGIELNPKYIKISEKRISNVQVKMII